MYLFRQLYLVDKIKSTINRFISNKCTLSVSDTVYTSLLCVIFNDDGIVQEECIDLIVELNPTKHGTGILKFEHRGHKRKLLFTRYTSITDEHVAIWKAKLPITKLVKFSTSPGSCYSADSPGGSSPGGISSPGGTSSSGNSVASPSGITLQFQRKVKQRELVFDINTKTTDIHTAVWKLKLPPILKSKSLTSLDNLYNADNNVISSDAAIDTSCAHAMQCALRNLVLIMQCALMILIVVVPSACTCTS